MLGHVGRALEREPRLSVKISKEGRRPEAVQRPAGLLQDAGAEDVPLDLILGERESGKVALNADGDHPTKALGWLGMRECMIDGKAIVSPVDLSALGAVREERVRECLDKCRGRLGGVARQRW